VSLNPTKVKGAQRDNLIPTSDRNMQDRFQQVKEVQECHLI